MNLTVTPNYVRKTSNVMSAPVVSNKKTSFTGIENNTQNINHIISIMPLLSKAGREASMVMSNLSNEAKTRIYETIIPELYSQEGLRGKLLVKLLKFQEYFAKKTDARGSSNFYSQSFDELKKEGISDFIEKDVIPQSMNRFFNKNGTMSIEFDNISDFETVGKQIKVRNTGIELGSDLRKQVVELLENSKSWKEVDEGIQHFKSIYE